MAGERIKIFELDIDVDAAIKASKQFGEESSELKKRLDELKKSGDTTSEEFVELEAKYKSVRKEYNSSQNELGKLINLQGKNIKTIEQGRAALSVVSKEWAKQADLYGENSDAAQKLTKQKTELTERLKELESQTGDNRRNVGDYAGGVREALGIDQSYTTATEALATAKQHLTWVTGKSTGAMKLFRIALASTGIGLLIIALGSLISYFATTQEGVNKIRKVLIPLKTIFESLFGVLQNLGKRMVDTFSNPKQAVKDLWEAIKTNLVNRIEGLGLTFKAIGKIISSGFTEGYGELTDAVAQTGTGIEDFTAKVKKAAQETGKFLSDAANRGLEMEKIRQNLSATEDDFIRRQAVLKREFEEQKKIAEDTTKTIAEREAAAEKSIGAQEKLRAITVERLEKEAQLIKMQQQSNDTSDSESADLARKLAEIDNAIAEEAAKTTEAQNKLNSIRKEGYNQAVQAAEEQQRKAQEATDAAIQESKLRLQIYIEENKGKADTLKDSISLEEKVRDKKLSILKDELGAKKLSQTEYELAVLQTKNEFLDQQAQLTEEYAQKKIEAERIALEKSRELEDQERARKIADLENQMEVDAENFASQMELEKQRLGIQRDQELAEAEKTGADKALILKKYAKLEEDINYHKESTKRKQAAQTFGDVAKLLGEQTAAGKAAAIAQATINTYQGVTEVWRSPSILPEPFGTIQKVISTGTVLASGLGAVQKITSTNTNVPKAAKGITLRGKSHSEGGERLFDESGNPVVEAEGGENIYVLNKRASGLINSLSYLNQSTGGIPLSQTATYAAAGGMIQKSISMGSREAGQTVDYDLMAEKIAEANRSLPSPQVAVTEINDGQGKYADIVDGANW